MSQIVMESSVYYLPRYGWKPPTAPGGGTSVSELAAGGSKESREDRPESRESASAARLACMSASMTLNRLAIVVIIPTKPFTALSTRSCDKIRGG